MIPAREDLVLAVGAAFGPESIIYTIKRSGLPLDLTACQVEMLGYGLQGGQALFSWKSQEDKLTLGGAMGTVTPAVTGAETAAIWSTPGLITRSLTPYRGMPTYLAGTWVMDISGPDGLFLRPLQGNLLLIPTFN